jgi:hypothetical protein
MPLSAGETRSPSAANVITVVGAVATLLGGGGVIVGVLGLVRGGGEGALVWLALTSMVSAFGIMLLYFGRARRQLSARVVVLAVVLLLLGLAGAWTLSFSMRTTVRWALSASRYKRQVLDLPQAAGGHLRHIEWDGWGFAGENTVAYLVFDPSDQLKSAGPTRRAGKLPGLPCDVYQVRQLDSSWYTVLFYTDTDWEHCV